MLIYPGNLILFFNNVSEWTAISYVLKIHKKVKRALFE